MTDEVINLTTYYYKKAEIDSLLNQKIDKVLLADVATSGSYNDLDDLPDLSALSSNIDILTIAQLTQSSTKLGGFNVPAYSGYVAEELQPGNFYLTKNGLGAAPSNYGGVHSIYDSKGDRYIIKIADDVNLNTYQSISINNRIPGPLFVYCTSSDLKLVNNLSTVEYTGDYNDLTNKPSIPDISGKINVSDVKDNLTSTDTDKPLSANQGKVLKELVDNKANASHTHHRYEITDMYTYEISASDYNVDIDSTVTINVKVKTMGGNPVAGMVVPVLKNNKTWQSGTTDVNGTFSLTYTADTWGLVMFSANTSNTQINVTGWRKYSHNSESLYTVHYNQDLVRLIVHLSNKVNVSNNWNGWQNILTDDFIRPQNGIVRIDNSGQVLIRVSPTSDNINFKTVNNTSISTTVYAEIIWKRK